MKRAPSNERELVVQIMEAIHAQYPSAWMLKVVGSPWQASGVPDILVVVDGMLFGMEVKHQKPGESEAYARARATELQKLQIRLISRAGAVSGVILSVEEALEMIATGRKRWIDEAWKQFEARGEERDVGG